MKYVQVGFYYHLALSSNFPLIRSSFTEGIVRVYIMGSMVSFTSEWIFGSRSSGTPSKILIYTFISAVDLRDLFRDFEIYLE